MKTKAPPRPPSPLFFSVEVEVDGRTSKVDLLPELETRDWLWRIVSRGMTQTSLVRIKRMDIFRYDKESRLFGWPGDVDPLTNRLLRFTEES